MQSARGFEYGVKHIISPKSGPLCDVLVGILQMSAADISLLLDLGAIYVNHERVKDNSSVSVNDYLRVHTKPRRFPRDDGRWRERLIFENENFLVVNKISGLPVHASVDNRQENLQRYLENTLGIELFITHRLDVPTRGLMVYAKTLPFQSAFNQLLISREMTKIYRAEVEGKSLRPGLLKHFMEPSPRAPKTVHHQERPGWQECLLEILEVIPRQDSHRSTAKIKLLTGRTHQIRAQLGYEKNPIVGDHAYGAPKISDEERIELEACELAFVDPLSGQQHHFKI